MLFLVNQSFSQQHTKWLDSICQNFKKEQHIVGMTVAVIKPDTSYYSVSGLRKQDESDVITLKNKFFLASLSKAFTSFIAKKMEEDGVISFETKFFDVFPELLTEKKAKKYAEITLGNLLSHKAKINDVCIYDETQILKEGTHAEKRYHLAKLTLSKSPKGKNKYSNVGYIMAAMMLEKTTGVSFEKLIQKTLHDLSLTYVIGYPNTHNKKDTWGHNVLSKKERSFELSEFNFYKDFQLPCWGLSMSTIDYSKFIQMHLNGLLGNDNVLKSKSYKELHQTFKKRNYGWEKMKLGAYTISTHDGSGDVFFGRTIIVAKEEIAISILMNQTVSDLKAINDLLEEIVAHYKK